MTDLGLRVITIGHSVAEAGGFQRSIYTKWERLKEEEKKQIITALVDKEIDSFNLNFDASQLKHAGFLVEKNSW